MAFSKQIFDKALLELSFRKQQAALTLRQRQEEVYNKIPAIKKIEKELANTSIDVARAILSKSGNTDELLQGLKIRNLTLQQQRQQLLIQNQFPSNYLEDVYTCPVCQDEGYINGVRCQCFEQLLKQIAYEQLNKISPLQLSSFESFQLSYYPANPENGSSIIPRSKMENIFHFCRQYALGFSSSSSNLMMMGRTGLGKTHLSLAIGREVIEKGFGVIYVSAQNIFDKIEQEHFSKSGSEKESTLSLVLSCDLLILDDLGAEFSTNFTVSMLYNIINTRINAHIPTIINTNLSLLELQQKYSERIVSRIIGEYTVLKFWGNDIRQIKQQQKLQG